MKILVIRLNDVLVWLDEDYNIRFEAENTTSFNVFNALCFIKGTRRRK